MRQILHFLAGHRPSNRAHGHLIRNLFQNLPLLALLFALLGPSLSWAQDDSTPQEEPLFLPQFQTLAITGNGSIFDTWVVTKAGVGGYFKLEDNRSWEIDYAVGSLGFDSFGIDIGRFTEQRLNLSTRSFGKRNSLNFILGVFYNKIDVKLGRSLLETLPSEIRPNADVVETAMVGLTWGLGNRWENQNGFVFGVDWFSIHIPVLTVQESIPFLDQSSDASSREEVRDALRWIKHIPTFSFLRVQVGYHF